MKKTTVTKVIVTTVSTDGKEEIHNINPEEVEALFWSDQAVNKILAPFYKDTLKTIPAEKLKSTFDESTLQLVSLGEDLRITPELVKSMWQLKYPDGHTPGFILKKIDCIPRPKK